MNRLGCVLLLVFAIVIGGFVAIVHRGGAIVTAPRPVTASGTSGAPASGAAMPNSAGLIIPVAGVRPAQLVDSFNDPRGGGRLHHAIDIMAPRGTPIVAAAGGTVEKLFESKDGGHTVYVRRADPAWIDYYAHLDSYAPDLREGVAVRQGQRIGAVGSSGDADPAAPHLHFEIKRMAPGEGWWKGVNVDPYPLLAGKPAAR